MDKSKLATSVTKLVFLVVFNIIFFMAGGTDRPASVWIAYAFIHFAYLCMLFTPVFVSSGKSAVIYGLSLSAISTAYFVAELLLGIIIILIAPSHYKFFFFVQLILAAVYVVIFMTTVRVNEASSASEAKHDMEVSFVKTASSRIKALCDTMNDASANKEIEKAFDVLHSSPTKSTAAVKALEAQIVMQIGDLEHAASVQNAEAASAAARNIVSLVQERNRQVNFG